MRGAQDNNNQRYGKFSKIDPSITPVSHRRKLQSIEKTIPKSSVNHSADPRGQINIVTSIKSSMLHETSQKELQTASNANQNIQRFQAQGFDTQYLPASSTAQQRLAASTESGLNDMSMLRVSNAYEDKHLPSGIISNQILTSGGITSPQLNIEAARQHNENLYLHEVLNSGRGSKRDARQLSNGQSPDNHEGVMLKRNKMSNHGSNSVTSGLQRSQIDTRVATNTQASYLNSGAPQTMQASFHQTFGTANEPSTAVPKPMNQMSYKGMHEHYAKIQDQFLANSITKEGTVPPREQRSYQAIPTSSAKHNGGMIKSRVFAMNTESSNLKELASGDQLLYSVGSNTAVANNNNGQGLTPNSNRQSTQGHGQMAVGTVNSSLFTSNHNNYQDFQPFPKAANITAKSFFNSDVTSGSGSQAQARRQSDAKATRAQYPQLATAQREQQIATLVAMKNGIASGRKKRSVVAETVGTQSSSMATPGSNRVFRGSNNLTVIKNQQHQINKGNYFEIPSARRLNSLVAQNVIFTQRKQTDDELINIIKNRRNYGNIVDQNKVKGIKFEHYQKNNNIRIFNNLRNGNSSSKAQGDGNLTDGNRRLSSEIESPSLQFHSLMHSNQSPNQFDSVRQELRHHSGERIINNQSTNDHATAQHTMISSFTEKQGPFSGHQNQSVQVKSALDNNSKKHHQIVGGADGRLTNTTTVAQTQAAGAHGQDEGSGGNYNTAKSPLQVGVWGPSVGGTAKLQSTDGSNLDEIASSSFAVASTGVQPRNRQVHASSDDHNTDSLAEHNGPYNNEDDIIHMNEAATARKANHNNDTILEEVEPQNTRNTSAIAEEKVSDSIYQGIEKEGEDEFGAHAVKTDDDFLQNSSLNKQDANSESLFKHMMKSSGQNEPIKLPVNEGSNVQSVEIVLDQGSSNQDKLKTFTETQLDEKFAKAGVEPNYLDTQITNVDMRTDSNVSPAVDADRGQVLTSVNNQAFQSPSLNTASVRGSLSEQRKLIQKSKQALIQGGKLGDIDNQLVKTSNNRFKEIPPPHNNNYIQSRRKLRNQFATQEHLNEGNGRFDKDGSQLSEHEIKINKHVSKVLMRVHQIQQEVRSKPTSLQRMQFLNKFEDSYGFSGYQNIEGKDRSYKSRSTLQSKTISKNHLLNSEGTQNKHLLSPLNNFIVNKARPDKLFDLSLRELMAEDSITEEVKLANQQQRQAGKETTSAEKHYQHKNLNRGQYVNPNNLKMIPTGTKSSVFGAKRSIERSLNSVGQTTTTETGLTGDPSSALRTEMSHLMMQKNQSMTTNNKNKSIKAQSLQQHLIATGTFASIPTSVKESTAMHGSNATHNNIEIQNQGAAKGRDVAITTVDNNGDDIGQFTSVMSERLRQPQKRSVLENQVVMNWLRNLARSPSKEKHLKDRYYRRNAEISADKQIQEMFVKLDTDGSNAISMDEMQELFLENGIEMTREQVAEMFSIVKKINDSEWLNKNAARQAFMPKKPYVQSIAEKLKLQLSQKDFKMVTKRPEALRQLNKVLLEHRNQMRAQNVFKFIPVTIDELMFRFCLNEKRKECESIWKQNTEALLSKDINRVSDEEIYECVDQTIKSISRMIGEDNSEFSRFRNEQNRIYLKLLEKGNAYPEFRNSLLIGTEAE